MCQVTKFMLQSSLCKNWHKSERQEKSKYSFLHYVASPLYPIGLIGFNDLFIAAKLNQNSYKTNIFSR